MPQSVSNNALLHCKYRIPFLNRISLETLLRFLQKSSQEPDRPVKLRRTLFYQLVKNNGIIALDLIKRSIGS
jgi:hypothetical protein